MIRTLALIAVAAGLTACAVTQTSPQQAYRPRGADAQVMLSGAIEISPTLRMLTVRADGEPIITGDVIAISLRPIDLAGTWHGRPALALCSQSSGYGQAVVTCRIILDGEFAASLTFQ